MEYEPCLQDGKRPSITKISGPDGLEAWLVAFAALFVNFIMAGLGRASGFLYVAFMDSFHIDRGQASLPISVRSSLRNLFGPVVGILGQKYGIRPVMILGGVIGSLSAASCFFLDDIGWITVVWGGINGVGAAFITTLPQVLIGQHFKKYRTTASGMAFSGGCIGSFVFPALMEYLLNTYMLAGTFLILSGLLMHVIPAAILFKTPSWWKSEKKTKVLVSTVNCEKVTGETKFNYEDKVNVKSEDNVIKETQDAYSTTVPRETSGLYDKQGLEGKQLLKNVMDADFLWENRYVLVKLLTINFTLQYNQSDRNETSEFPIDDALIQEIETFYRNVATSTSDGGVSLENNCNVSISRQETDFDGKCSQSKDTHFNNGALESKKVNPEINLKSVNHVFFCLQKLFENERHNLIKPFSEEQHETVNRLLDDLWRLYSLLANYKRNSFSCAKLSKNSKYLEGSSNSIGTTDVKSNTFYSHIKTAFMLYKQPLFLLICLCRTHHFLTFMPVVTVIIDFAKDKGLQTEDGKYVINALSLGDLMGRLCLGWITDRGYVSLPKYMLIVMVLQGIATIAIPFMKSKAAIMISIAVFGLLQGSVFVRHPVLVSRYLKTHEQSIAMGCINFFSGLISLFLPVYIGYFRDDIGSYDGIFFINGSLGIVIASFWIFEPYFVKISSRSQSNGGQQTQV